ncbi:hypothetical protein ACFSQD_14850 [Flavihumibacter stibioxidans]|uniref:GAF domain-containing protein n=1 Tax=Flavihumibacter stibioxidans TaxID=1834163 RepID=A0ABR7M7V4_9BACT|nr:hypothetical protein [Flavihumibacter stibioxidans]MBC6491118.1 hypothetical protein [Flavihumibacter stibioxidans]
MEAVLQGEVEIKSRLSFGPLVEAWKKNAAEGRPGTRKLYRNLLDRIRLHPELLDPIDDLSMLDQHQEWVEMLMTTLFPVSFSDQDDLYAVAVPFSQDIIYSSTRFSREFLDEKGLLKHLPVKLAEQHLNDEKCSTAYKLILSKFYGQKIDGNVTSIIKFTNPVNGLVNYFELDLDPTFMDVIAEGDLPDIKKQIHCCNVEEVMRNQSLQQMLPLHLFRFEGLSIARIKDVTQREVINNIKNILLEQHSFDDSVVFHQLENEMQALIGVADVKMGLTPFLQVNDHYVFSEQYLHHSMLLQPVNGKTVRLELCKVFIDLFRDSDMPVLFETINEDDLTGLPMLGRVFGQGYHSAAFFPLKSNGKLIGVMSAVHRNPGILQRHHLSQVSPSLPLFVLALEKAAEALDNEVDKVIKKHFTAVQASVEWKFTDAALHYLINKKQGIKAKIEPIVFENVFPLYGAIDIRNSTVERNNAIQQDLLEQLTHAGEIIRVAQDKVTMPLLQEVAYRIEKYQYNVSNILFSGDEVTIDLFLRNEVVELLEHLRLVVPELSGKVDEYFTRVDPKIRLRVDHRQDFEESITLINQELARFMDTEQDFAQKIYPHYFERFVTDGVDFNMYIGQSISPEKPFDTFYLKNLKMWQMTTLARAAQMVHQLQDRLLTRLQTTQLILAHGLPISISFRTAERKFDVDGAYNIRYEIIKKRIDKVHVRGTNERLTQPGKLAIVFSQTRDAAEYLDFIEFLQNQGLLLYDLEQLELEELQGVVGLQALRVGINMDKADRKYDAIRKPEILVSK